MNERKDVGALSSLLRSKPIIIAAVAAVAMLLGAMSVGAAVNQYQKRAALADGFPASANPFSRRTPTSRHVVEETPSTPQVAAAETVSQEPAATLPVNSPPDPEVTTDNITRVPIITPPAITLPEPAPVIVPVAQATQPVVNTITQIVAPVVPPPVQQLLNSVTRTMPTGIDVGLVKITLPKIGL